MRPTQSGIWLSCQNAGQRRKQKDITIASYSICTGTRFRILCSWNLDFIFQKLILTSKRESLPLNDFPANNRTFSQLKFLKIDSPVSFRAKTSVSFPVIPSHQSLPLTCRGIEWTNYWRTRRDWKRRAYSRDPARCHMLIGEFCPVFTCTADLHVL